MPGNGDRRQIHGENSLTEENGVLVSLNERKSLSGWPRPDRRRRLRDRAGGSERTLALALSRSLREKRFRPVHDFLAATFRALDFLFFVFFERLFYGEVLAAFFAVIVVGHEKSLVRGSVCNDVDEMILNSRANPLWGGTRGSS